MLSQTHETHIHSYAAPLLPFIFHLNMQPSSQYGMVNWHTNIELLHVRSGQGFVLYDGEEIPMREGDTVIVNTNALHSFRANPNATCNQPFLYDCLIIDREFCTQNGLDINACHFTPHFNDIVMRKKMDDLRSAWALGPLAIVPIRAAILSILAHILQMSEDALLQQTPDPNITDKNRHIKRAIRHMEEHLAEPLSLTSTADAIGISRCHLAHLFRKSTGMSVVSYIQMLRCRHAMMLLGGSDMPISEVAHECGFESVSYFDRCFVRLYGQTPRQIRARRT